MDVIIRADGGSEIGYGHLFRSAALAEELQRNGETVTVATTTPQPARTVFPESVTISQLPSRSDPSPFIDWLDTAATDVVFTDCYPVDTSYQQAVRQRVPLAVLQDDARHAVCADLLVNGNLYAADLDYTYVGQQPKACLGPDYVILRREVRARLQKDPAWRPQPERALITMGGSDTAGLTPTAVRAFDGFDLRVDAVVGPGCPAELEQEVRKAAATSSTKVRVSRNPETLVTLMAEADFAVSTASTTTYELLALGTPILSIPVANNQEAVASSLRRRDIATVLQRTAGEKAFRNAIKELIQQTELRRTRQRRGRELVDGNGVIRVRDALRSITETRADQ
ncbi:UDP-2,4-diacetamido-2,4,6-trideoxy-beta-L-altropyranose hydrolase [Halohasta salina]|uniref:UDP-2,4-diacetamido-2,4, 6-trideoxy-beta-L-altropyranose hydrolase n=1 Tax=Halohasta salina TaxID=2961621 RepID=UPI0020A40808|nr:UDP-2,4-diacetamido-2,4,6-trideoxy-beta-L-altropyranose hydrolase [Halohasta salina]